MSASGLPAATRVASTIPLRMKPSTSSAASRRPQLANSWASALMACNLLRITATQPLSSGVVSVPQLRPLGVGEILDVGITIYRRNSRALLTLVFVVVAPFEVLSALDPGLGAPRRRVHHRDIGHRARSTSTGSSGSASPPSGSRACSRSSAGRRHRRLLQGDRGRLPRRARRVAAGARATRRGGCTRSSG